MTLETTEKQLTNKKYWIRFVEATGKVAGISSSKPDIVKDGYNVIQSDNEDLKLLLKGKANIKDYLVKKNALTEDWLFSKKSRELELQPTRKKFEQVPLSTHVEENDIFVTFYKQSMKVVVALNKTRVIKNNNLATISDVVENEYSLLNLFVCKKNDPDRLISIIEVDAKLLVKYSKLILNLPETILDYADIDQLSIFVLPVFEKYGINFVDKFIETPDLKGQSKLLNQNTLDDGLINIHTVNDNVLEIKHNANESQFSLFKNQSKLRFVVCNKHVDNFIGGFEVNVNELLSTDSLKIKLSFDIPDSPLFFYKNNNISVSYNGEKT